MAIRDRLLVRQDGVAEWYGGLVLSGIKPMQLKGGPQRQEAKSIVEG